MPEVMVPYDVVICERAALRYVRFPIKHGDCNGYEERCGGGSPQLILTSGGFIKGVVATLPHWYAIHAGPATPAGDGHPRLVDLLRATNFAPDEDAELFRVIALDSRSAVVHSYDGLTVYVLLDTFIVGAIRSLYARNTLPIQHWGWDFCKQLRADWDACIARLGGEPRSPQTAPTAREADYDPSKVTC
jgi:hypothetical protein